MTTPYNQALGATLIERTKRERIVLVGVTLPGHTDADTEEGLDELSLLIDTAGADEAGRLVQRPAGCLQLRSQPGGPRHRPPAHRPVRGWR